MTYAIRVKANSDDSQVFFEKKFATEDEFQAVVDLCVSRRGIGLFESTVITVRTDTLNNFCKDFFFPTLINRALKTHDVALKILLIGYCFCLDVCTLAFRLITLVPRYLANAQCPRHEHPLHKYMLAQGAVPETIAIDRAFVELEWREGRRGLPAAFESDENKVTRGETFNFIQLPQFETPISAEYSRVGISAPRSECKIELLN